LTDFVIKGVGPSRFAASVKLMMMTLMTLSVTVRATTPMEADGG
jgi:hypothetical protein